MQTVRVFIEDGDLAYALTIEEDSTPVRGNALCSGDEATDRACEDEILRRLDQYDTWAWALVRVTAETEIDGEIFKGAAYLSGCSYNGTDDFLESGYWEQMKAEARDDLRNELHRAQARGLAASRRSL